MLLYCGPYTDLRPLMRFSHSHKEFVYVDGLPESKYYTVTVNGLCDEMVAELKRERAYDSHEMKSDHFIIRTIGGQTLYYFYNVLDTNMFDKSEMLSNMLLLVTALYMQGYAPTINQNLPSLRTLIYTDGCSPHPSLKFDWQTMEKIEIPEYQKYYDAVRPEGGPTGSYMRWCAHCDNPAHCNEYFWHAKASK